MCIRDSVGMGARMTYAYARKYIGEFSMGLQAAETFKKGNRAGFFPAGSIAWVISEEDFFGENNLIRLLKLRASYGLTGNDKINGDRLSLIHI